MPEIHPRFGIVSSFILRIHLGDLSSPRVLSISLFLLVSCHVMHFFQVIRLFIGTNQLNCGRASERLHPNPDTQQKHAARCLLKKSVHSDIQQQLIQHTHDQKHTL